MVWTDFISFPNLFRAFISTLPILILHFSPQSLSCLYLLSSNLNFAYFFPPIPFVSLSPLSHSAPKHSIYVSTDKTASAVVAVTCVTWCTLCTVCTVCAVCRVRTVSTINCLVHTPCLAQLWNSVKQKGPHSGTFSAKGHSARYLLISR
jgi:hypothetical protein